MIIGIDAGALSISDDRLKVGVWRVTHELLVHLTQTGVHHTYRLYSFAPISKSLLKAYTGDIEPVVFHPPVGYMKVRLPIELLVRPVDVFLGLSQAIPRMTSGTAVGCIYDLGFLSYPQLYGFSAASLKEQTDYIAARANRIITISNSIKKEIVGRYAIPPSRISVCYPGVGDVFRKSGKAVRKPYPFFLFVGSLRKGKDIPSLLRSFARARKTGNIREHLVLIGGDYWPDEEIPRTIAKLGLSGVAHRLGHVPDETLASYYRGATAFVTASKSEGFCLPVVEAFASGCPVIAPSLPAMKELIGSAGMLIGRDDEFAMARAMVRLATGKEIRAEYGKRGLARARKFTWERFSACVRKEAGI